MQLVVSNISIFINSEAILILPGHHSPHHNRGVEHTHRLLQPPVASWVYKAHLPSRSHCSVRRTDRIPEGIVPASLDFDTLSRSNGMKYCWAFYFPSKELLMIPGIPNKKFVLVRAKEIMGWQTLVANSQTSATPSSRVHIMSPPLFHSGLTFWKGIGCRQKCSVSDQRLLSQQHTSFTHSFCFVICVSYMATRCLSGRWWVSPNRWKGSECEPTNEWELHTDLERLPSTIM